MSDLGSFEGKPVIASKVIVRKAGDGLTKPLAAEPRAFHSGMRVPMLLWGTIGGIDHEPATEGVGVIRVHDFITEEAAVLDHVELGMLDDLLAAQREKVRLWDLEQKRLKDEAKGIHELPLGADDEDDGESDEDADWESEARAQAPASLGSKRAAKAKEAAG